MPQLISSGRLRSSRIQFTLFYKRFSIVIKMASSGKKQTYMLSFIKSSAEVNNNKIEVSSSPKKPKLVFQPKWLKSYFWLRYDEDKKEMYCELCKTLNYVNIMAVGTNNFKTTTLQRHCTSSDHLSAVSNKKDRQQFEEAVLNADSKESSSIMLVMKVVYWLAKECIPLSKYTSLMELLQFLGTPNMNALKVGENINNSSYKTACDILCALSELIDDDVTKKLHKSPTITLLTDESTDIVVHHKLCISARVVDPVDLKPSTLFLTDLRITSATGEGIFNAIKEHLGGRNIQLSKVSGLGTDGATVMTGKKKGLTGRFMECNPHLVNTHCSAHRLALSTEQAAEKIQGMKYYQQILESIFYYFKKSPARCDKLEAVQKLLNDPCLKYREDHQVRWLSFYEALDAVYRTMDCLLSLFSSCTDPKAMGFKKKIGDDFFLYTTYSMMGVLRPVMALNLFFQKRDVDIGCVQVSVDACLTDLNKMLKQEDLSCPFLNKFTEDMKDNIYKGQHHIVKSKYNAVSCRELFITALIDNISTRFPDKHIMTSFCALSMRPITFLDDEELESWGNDSLDLLLNHFGTKMSHSYIDSSGDNRIATSDALLDANATRTEWSLLKKTVKNQQYPRNNTQELWAMISRYHSDQFPNLIYLAALALTHPVHTADCERAFSAQNSITIPLRNRLSPDHCSQLMRVMIQGSKLQDFDFKGALKIWKSAKFRKIFQ